MSEAQIKNATIEWIKGVNVERRLNFTLTMRPILPHTNQRVVSQDVVKNTKYFNNILNYKIYKNKYKRFGKRVKFITVIEWNELNQPHIHGIVEIPKHYSEEDFKDIFLMCWQKTDLHWIEHHFEAPDTSEGELLWIYYMMKGRTKKSTLIDSLDFENSSWTN